MFSGAPPYGEPESEVPNADPYVFIKNWQRPEGAARVGVQKSATIKTTKYPKNSASLKTIPGPGVGENGSGK